MRGNRLVVSVDDLLRRPERIDEAVAEQQRAVAELRDRAEVVADEDDRLAVAAEAVEGGEALLLEALVADSEHLVEQEDVEVHLDRDRVREAQHHPGRVVLELPVDETLELGERD